MEAEDSDKGKKKKHRNLFDKEPNSDCYDSEDDFDNESDDESDEDSDDQFE